MDAPAALKTVATGKMAFTDPSSIYLDGKNVLGLVVELDTALLGGATWWPSSPRPSPAACSTSGSSASDGPKSRT